MQVEIPGAARSALEVLRKQRMQKQAVASTSPPVADSLPPSLSTHHHVGKPAWSTGHQTMSGDQVNSGNEGQTAHKRASVKDALSMPTDHPDGSNGQSAQTDRVPLTDMLPMFTAGFNGYSDQTAQTEKAAPPGHTVPLPVSRLKSISTGAPVRDSLDVVSELADSIAESAPMHDTLAISTTIGKGEGDSRLDDDDEVLIRQAVDSQVAGAAPGSPGVAKDEDDVLLQGLLDEEEH